MALRYKATERETCIRETENRARSYKTGVRALTAGGAVPGRSWQGIPAGRRGTSLSQEPVAKVSAVCRLPGGNGRQRVLLIFCDTNLA